jgi:hypothetical protein
VKKDWDKKEINFLIKEFKKGYSRFEIAKKFFERFGYSRSPDSIKHGIDVYAQHVEKDTPKVLLVDIETKPKKSWHWNVWEENINHTMMIEDGAILSWSAKWIGEKEIFYKDQRGKEKDLMNDKELLKPLVKLMSEADIIVWQNGDSFDYGEINNRIAEHSLPIPNEYKTIDTKKIAKRHLRLPWYSLAYMTARFNKKYKKQEHKEFPGWDLWGQCMRGNRKAWECMKKYNQFDVLSMEELFVDTLAKFAKGNARVASAIRAYEKAIKGTK